MPDYGPGPVQQQVLLWMLEVDRPVSRPEIDRDVPGVRSHPRKCMAYRTIKNLMRRSLVYQTVGPRSWAAYYILSPEGIRYCKEQWPKLFKPPSSSSSESSS